MVLSPCSLYMLYTFLAEDPRELATQGGGISHYAQDCHSGPYFKAMVPGAYL